MATEIVENGKIITDTVMSPFIPNILAVIYKIFGNYVIFTFIQTFLFYIGIHMTVSILINKCICIKNLKIEINWIISSIIISIPIVQYFPLINTDSSLVTTGIALIIYSIFKFTGHIKTIGLSIGIFIMIATRINALTVIPIIYAMLYYIKKENEKRFILNSVAIMITIVLVILFNNSFTINKHKVAALGMAWEICGIAKENKNEYDHVLDFVGDTEKVLNIYKNEYLNNIFWDNEPPIPVYDVIDPINAEQIKKIYIDIMIKNPQKFFKNKINFIKRTLGIGDELLPISRGIHRMDDRTKNMEE